MMWLVFTGMLIVSALVVWGVVGIAMTVARPEERASTRRVVEALSQAVEAQAAAPAAKPAVVAAPSAVAKPAAVVSSGDRMTIQYDLSGVPEEALNELLGEEVRLAEEAHARGLDRAARLHASIAAGIRNHLDETGAEDAGHKGSK